MTGRKETNEQVAARSDLTEKACNRCGTMIAWDDTPNPLCAPDSGDGICQRAFNAGLERAAQIMEAGHHPEWLLSDAPAAAIRAEINKEKP